MQLARFPRARFAHLPTPLEPAPRLAAELGLDLGEIGGAGFGHV